MAYSDGSRVESFVDAEVASGNSVAWWLEFREIAGSWVIESSVLLTTSIGQDDIRQLPTRYAVGLGELTKEVENASQMLVAALHMEDLSSF